MSHKQIIHHHHQQHLQIHPTNSYSSDLRTPPVQSKSFRILQKITDTIDDGNNDDSGNQQRNDNYMDAEPQLQRPTFARQMSAQQARNSPTVEQMRRMKIGHEQGKREENNNEMTNKNERATFSESCRVLL